MWHLRPPDMFLRAYIIILMNDIKHNSKNVLIYGAGESGILTYNALSNHSKNIANVVGYIDNDKQKIGKQINGVKVYGNDVLNRRFYY